MKNIFKHLHLLWIVFICRIVYLISRMIMHLVSVYLYFRGYKLTRDKSNRPVWVKR